MSADAGAVVFVGRVLFSVFFVRSGWGTDAASEVTAGNRSVRFGVLETSRPAEQADG